MQYQIDEKSGEADLLLVNIGQNIDFLMKKNRMDAQTLSRLAGIGIATVNSLRRGAGNPTIATISSIAEVFGVTIGDITDGNLSDLSAQEELTTSVPLIRYDDLDAYLTGNALPTRFYKLAIQDKQEKLLFAVEFTNNLLSPCFDSNTVVVLSKTTNFCDSDLVLVKIQEAPVCFRQIFVGESGIYFSLLGMDNEKKPILTRDYTLIGVVIRSIKNMK